MSQYARLRHTSGPIGKTAAHVLDGLAAKGIRCIDSAQAVNTVCSVP